MIWMVYYHQRKNARLKDLLNFVNISFFACSSFKCRVKFQRCIFSVFSYRYNSVLYKYALGCLELDPLVTFGNYILRKKLTMLENHVCPAHLVRPQKNRPKSSLTHPKLKRSRGSSFGTITKTDTDAMHIVLVRNYHFSNLWNLETGV